MNFKTFCSILLSLIFMSNSAAANDIQAYRFFNELSELINRSQLEKDIDYEIGGVTVAKQCESFMNADMFYGKNGASIFRSFIKNNRELPLLTDGGSITKYCPKYSTMDLEKKALVWVAVLTMIAHFESSCDISSKNRGGPNGTAYGYYQLHLGKEHFYDGDSKFCSKNASKSPEQSHLCMLGMLELQLEKQGGEIFSSRSYWEVLRPKGRAKKADDIQRAISRSSLCNPLLQ